MRQVISSISTKRAFNLRSPLLLVPKASRFKSLLISHPPISLYLPLFAGTHSFTSLTTSGCISIRNRFPIRTITVYLTHLPSMYRHISNRKPATSCRLRACSAGKAMTQNASYRCLDMTRILNMVPEIRRKDNTFSLRCSSQLTLAVRQLSIDA